MKGARRRSMESTPPANPRPAEGAPTHTLRVVRGGVGIGAVVTRALGGALGARWHGRLERLALKEEQERQDARESFRDLREATATPVEATPAAPAPAVTMPMAPAPVAATPAAEQHDRDTEAGAGFVQDVEPVR